MNPLLTRRRLLLAAAAAGTASLAACAARSRAHDMPPIVFVPGNGDTAAICMTTIWRFESNGWPRERLHAIDMPYPLARDDDTREQPGRSSTGEHMAFLAAEVKRVLSATGTSKVVLVGNSRGGYAIRNFIASGGGALVVSHVVLGGVPNHGVAVDPTGRLDNEFNGAGRFLSRLNASGTDGNEVPAGIAWLTIRSDHNDKYAQSDGIILGRPGTPTGITFEGPALKGAENIVIAGLDHRETLYSPQSFAAMFRFITGRAPTTLAVVPESRVILDGTLSGLGLNNGAGTYPNNLPLAGATLEVYATDTTTGARLGPLLHHKTIGADGRWGPFVADGTAHYEFVVAAPGYATTHIYRSPFPRSSSIVSLHPERLADADRPARSMVTLNRSRGYFGIGRDHVALDGNSPPAGVAAGVPSVSAAVVRNADASERAIVGEFNDERIVGRTWPVADNHVVVLELTY